MNSLSLFTLTWLCTAHIFLLPCDSASFSSTDLEYIWILFSFSFVHYEKKFLYLILFLFVNYLSCIHIWVLTSNETRVKILPADIMTQLIGRTLGCELTL